MRLMFKVDSETSGKQIKHILKNKLNLSGRLIIKLKYNNKITLNGESEKVNVIVKENDILTVDLDFVEETEGIVSEKMDLEVIYEDNCIIAINKEPSVVVHPTARHYTGTIANGLKNYYEQKGIKRKIRPVSRLDKDTSGIIIFAKNEYVQENLIKQMQNGQMMKEYLGLVFGNPELDNFTINQPIDRKPGSIIERHISDKGRKSITHVHVIERFEKTSYLKFILETGRTHQIRVHCQHIGIPLVGDTLYVTSISNTSPINKLICRQALHSHMVKFKHPLTGEWLKLTAKTPPDMQNLLEILGNNH